MLIGLSIFVRVFLYKIILKAEETHPTAKWNDLMRQNLKVLASVLYRCTYDIYSNLEVFTPNLTEVRGKPCVPLTIDPTQSQNPYQPENILGLYTKDDLFVMYAEQSNYEKVLDNIKKFVAIIYIRINSYRGKHPEVSSF